MLAKNFKIKKNERKINLSCYSSPKNNSQDLSLNAKSLSINDLICTSIGKKKSKTMINGLISTSKDLIIDKSKFNISTNFPKNFRHFYPLKPSISHSLLNFSHNEEKTKLILSPRINDSFINIKDYSSPKNTLSAMRQSSAQYRINYNKYSKIRNKISNKVNYFQIKSPNINLYNKNKKEEINKNNLSDSFDNNNESIINAKKFKYFIDEINKNFNYIHKCKNELKQYFKEENTIYGNKFFFEEILNNYKFDEQEQINYFLTDIYSVKKNKFSIDQFNFSFKITSLQFIFYEILDENIKSKNVDPKLFYNLDKDINLKYNINSKFKFPFEFLSVFYGIEINEFIYLLISIIDYDYDNNKFIIDHNNFITKVEIAKSLYDFYTDISYFNLYNHNNSKECLLFDWDVKNQNNNKIRHFVLKILLPQIKMSIKCGGNCKVKFFSNINITSMGDLIKNKFNKWDYFLLVSFTELKLFRYEINKILCGKYENNNSYSNGKKIFKKDKNIKRIVFNLNPMNIILNTIKKKDKSYSFLYSYNILKNNEHQTFYITLKLPQITISYHNLIYYYIKKFDIDFKRLSQINKLRKSFLPEDLIKFSMNIIKGKNKENETNNGIFNVKKYLSKKSIKSFKRNSSLIGRDKNRNNSQRSNDSNISDKKKKYLLKRDGIKGQIKFNKNYNVNEEIIKDIKLNLDKYIFNFDESLFKYIKVKDNYKNKYNENFIKKNNPIKENIIKHNTFINNIQKDIENEKKFDIEIGTIELSWTDQDALTKNLMMNQKDSEYLLEHPPFQWKFFVEKNIEKILSDETNIIKPSRKLSKNNIYWKEFITKKDV